MTSRTQLLIDVRHLPLQVRSSMPEQLVHQPAAKTVQPTTYKTVYTDVSGERLATHLVVSLNMVDVLGQEFEVGTSVFAIGRCALELARIDLARAGLPKEALDQLDASHVTLQRIVAPYLIRFKSYAETRLFAQHLCSYSVLLGLNHQHCDAVNIVSYTFSAAALAAIGADSFLGDLVVTVVNARPEKHVIRIEVCIPGDYLHNRGWDTLDSWRTAHQAERYTAIFKETVRKMFRVDDPNLCIAEPSKEIIAYLNPCEKDVLRAYLHGKSSMSMMLLVQGKPNMTDTKRKSKLKVVSTKVHQQIGINMALSWSEFRRLGSSLIEGKFSNIEDYSPDTDIMPQHFCRENWSQFLNALKQRYADAKLDAAS